MTHSSVLPDHSAPKNTPAPDYYGHRKRLKERFLKGDINALSDHELIEMVLFLAHKRKDVKPLAKNLLKYFKSFSEIIAADHTELLKFEGLGESSAVALKLIHAAAIKSTQEKIVNQHILSSWRLVLDYCKTRMSHKKTEEFRIIYLDRKNKIITDECHREGTIDNIQIYPREIIKRALNLDASSLVLVHNHPSGDPAPSKADIELTQYLINIARPMGISIHDHLIIGKNGHQSLKSLQLIK